MNNNEKILTEFHQRYVTLARRYGLKVIIGRGGIPRQPGDIDAIEARKEVRSMPAARSANGRAIPAPIER